MAGIGRIAFLGSGSFAVPLLDRLSGLADELLVVSQPDRPAGRGLRAHASPVAAFARERGLALVTPPRLRSEEGRAALRDFRPDGLLLAAYGQLVPTDLLGVAARPPLNVHPSLLPRHRGAAPVAATILAGDDEAGVTLMVMTDEVDAGPIVEQWRLPLGGRESAPELEMRLAQLAAEVVPPLLAVWASPEGIGFRPQDASGATHTRPMRRADGLLNWRRGAVDLDRQVRALQPWPGAWTTLGPRRLHVRAAHPVDDGGRAPAGTLIRAAPPRVACGGGDALALDLVQPEGRRPMAAEEWVRGLPRGDTVVLGGVRPPPG